MMSAYVSGRNPRLVDDRKGRGSWHHSVVALALPGRAVVEACRVTVPLVISPSRNIAGVGMTSYGNDIITFELYGYRRPYTVSLRRLLELEAAFCDAAQLLSSTRPPGDGKGRRAKWTPNYRVDFALLDATQGSFIVRFKAAVFNFHTHRADFNAYAGIIALPLALIQLVGSCVPVVEQKPDEEYRITLEKVKKLLDEKEVKESAKRLERALSGTGAYQAIIIVPGAPTMIYTDSDPRPIDGTVYEFTWPVPMEVREDIAMKIAGLAGVDSVKTKIETGARSQKQAFVTVQIDMNISAQDVHELQERISATIKNMTVSSWI